MQTSTIIIPSNVSLGVVQEMSSMKAMRQDCFMPPATWCAKSMHACSCHSVRQLARHCWHTTSVCNLGRAKHHVHAVHVRLHIL